MQPNQPLVQDDAETTYYQPTEATPVPEVADAPQTSPVQLPEVEPVQWRSVEYLQQAKSALWYIGFAVVILVLMAIAIFVMNAWTFAILIPIMAGALIVYSRRENQEISYALSSQGLYINDQLHPLGEFKGFGVIQGAPLNSLVLIPTKRFRPSLTVYFPTEVGEQVVDLLGGYLPMQEVKPDAFDAIVQKLHM